MPRQKIGRKVLVADDEPAMQGVLRLILEDAGYDVQVAYDGGEALDKIEAGAPDLLILDLMMPGMDGWQVLEHLREREKRPAVIVVSAIGCDPHVVERARKAGAVRCLGKPFNFRELLATCDAAVRG